MPVVFPSGSVIYWVGTPGDPKFNLTNDVIPKVENRVTDEQRAWQWIIDTLLELTSDRDLRNEFDQLEEYGNMFTLTPGVQEYNDIQSFVPSGDINDSTLDFLIWIDPPQNQRRKRLDMVSYQETDKWIFANAQPIQCYRFGQVIGFYPVPDQAYQVQPRIQRQHPINNNNFGMTQILLPRDWNEIIILGAAMRGFIELEEYTKAKEIRDLLHGTVDDKGKIKTPGLIYMRKKRREQEAWRKEMPLRPVIRPYGYRAR